MQSFNESWRENYLLHYRSNLPSTYIKPSRSAVRLASRIGRLVMQPSRPGQYRPPRGGRSYRDAQSPAHPARRRESADLVAEQGQAEERRGQVARTEQFADQRGGWRHGGQPGKTEGDGEHVEGHIGFWGHQVQNHQQRASRTSRTRPSCCGATAPPSQRQRLPKILASPIKASDQLASPQTEPRQPGGRRCGIRRC